MSKTDRFLLSYRVPTENRRGQNITSSIVDDTLLGGRQRDAPLAVPVWVRTVFVTACHVHDPLPKLVLRIVVDEQRLRDVLYDAKAERQQKGNKDK